MALRDRLERALFRAWGRTPLPVRLFVVRRATPSFHVGALCVIERADGALLLVRNAYRKGWGFPGGFLKRGETPLDAARRETGEEVGVDVELDHDAKVVVDPEMRRVDVIFTGRSRADSGAPGPTPRSTEIVDVGWFLPTALPDLQKETVTALIQLGRSHRPPLDDR
jgi:8-oxo-dGTP diphosphatase